MEFVVSMLSILHLMSQLTAHVICLSVHQPDYMITAHIKGLIRPIGWLKCFWHSSTLSVVCCLCLNFFKAY